MPGATLPIPYFSVTGTVDAAGQIGSVGVDTKIAFTNVSGPGVIAHVTVWNKYSKAVLDFNVPMTGKDVVTMNMSSILSGHLNINTPMFDKVQYPDDVCGWLPGNPLPDYIPGPWIGWGSTDFLRFANPEFPTGTDWIRSVSQYDDPAFDATVGARLLDSLDQSGDVKSMAATGANVLDTTNYYCGLGTNPTITPGPLAVSGYVTIDVVNYFTNFFPDQFQFYENDAVSTSDRDLAWVRARPAGHRWFLASLRALDLQSRRSVRAGRPEPDRRPRSRRLCHPLASPAESARAHRGRAPRSRRRHPARSRRRHARRLAGRRSQAVPVERDDRDPATGLARRG